MGRNPLAGTFVVVVGALWGVYWMPLRQLEALVPAGTWLTLAVVLVACVLLAPAAWRGRRRLRASPRLAIASVALGGASFSLYSNGLLHGQVAVVILLFYLTPVWSTLIARFWLGWSVSWWRYAAIGCGLAGILLVLRGSHGGVPLPHDPGDWMGLASGFLWAVASTGIRVHSRTRPAETNFVFCVGAAALALPMALVLGDPGAAGSASAMEAGAVGWLLLLGGVWWAVSLTLFLWATQVIEPARVGILLMSEVIVGACSAALFAGEPFGPLVALGAALVIIAGALETLPGGVRRRGPVEDSSPF